MKPLLTLLVTWFGTGFGAFVGSVLGNAGGKFGLSLGAIAGGMLGVLATVNLASRLSWLPAAEVSGAFLGGVLGFAVAIPLTVTHMGTPLVPVLSCGLAGAGALIGAGVARGLSRTTTR